MSVIPDDEDDSSNLVGMVTIGLVILGIIVVIGLFVTRRKPEPMPDNVTAMVNQQFMEPMAQPMPQPTMDFAPPVQAPQGPPLPPEGLPPNWTMEQWAWYGEDYLRNR